MEEEYDEKATDSFAKKILAIARTAKRQLRRNNWSRIYLTIPPQFGHLESVDSTNIPQYGHFTFTTSFMLLLIQRAILSNIVVPDSPNWAPSNIIALIEQ